MISLRTVEGIDLRVMGERFGVERAEGLRLRAEKWVKTGHLKGAQEKLQLTREGKLLADGIAADLFI
jgi:oxygen-independent coproporphyrinogen-3 oxidase